MPCAPASWTADDDARLIELLAYEQDLPGLADFIGQVNPRRLPPPHLAPVIDVWERTRRGPVRAVIELPPRHAKTTTAVHGFAWRLLCDPGLTHAYTTYGESLSLSKSRVARRLARAAGVELAKDQQNLGEWRTVHGGGLLSTGVGGILTGQGITGVGVVDDALKNRKQAESARIRQDIWEWFTDVFWTRLEDDASCIVMATRWHEDDLIGRLVDRGVDGIEFERVRLPALAERGDLLGRQPGKALWPERFPLTKLREIRRMIGEYSWASLYQQRPRPRGNTLFEDPARFQLDDWLQEWRSGKQAYRLIIVCDPAATASTTADYSAVLVLAAQGSGDQMRLWVIDHFHNQVKIPELVRRLEVMRRLWRGLPVAVEAVGGFKAVPDSLREISRSLRILEINNKNTNGLATADKFTRSQPVAAAWNQGRVLVPIDRAWSEKLIGEAQAFTGVGDAHDDQVDALGHGFNLLFAAAQRSASRRRGARSADHMPFG